MLCCLAEPDGSSVRGPGTLIYETGSCANSESARTYQCSHRRYSTSYKSEGIWLIPSAQPSMRTLALLKHEGFKGIKHKFYEWGDSIYLVQGAILGTKTLLCLNITLYTESRYISTFCTSLMMDRQHILNMDPITKCNNQQPGLPWWSNG